MSKIAGSINRETIDRLVRQLRKAESNIVTIGGVEYYVFGRTKGIRYRLTDPEDDHGTSERSGKG